MSLKPKPGCRRMSAAAKWFHHLIHIYPLSIRSERTSPNIRCFLIHRKPHLDIFTISEHSADRMNIFIADMQFLRFLIGHINICHFALHHALHSAKDLSLSDQIIQCLILHRPHHIAMIGPHCQQFWTRCLNFGIRSWKSACVMKNAHIQIICPIRVWCRSRLFEHFFI